MQAVRVVHEGRVSRFYTPFHDEFRTTLKAEIPSPMRAWDSDLKCWVIAQPYVQDALAIARRFFKVIETGQQREHEHRAHTTGNGNGPYATLYVTADAPMEVIKAAYRALALLHHPDHGGDLQRMQEINAAFDKVRQLRGG